MRMTDEAIAKKYAKDRLRSAHNVRIRRDGVTMNLNEARAILREHRVGGAKLSRSACIAKVTAYRWLRGETTPKYRTADRIYAYAISLRRTDLTHA